MKMMKIARNALCLLLALALFMGQATAVAETSGGRTGNIAAGAPGGRTGNIAAGAPGEEFDVNAAEAPSETPDGAAAEAPGEESDANAAEAPSEKPDSAATEMTREEYYKAAAEAAFEAADWSRYLSDMEGAEESEISDGALREQPVPGSKAGGGAFDDMINAPYTYQTLEREKVNLNSGSLVYESEDCFHAPRRKRAGSEDRHPVRLGQCRLLQILRGAMERDKRSLLGL
jgi:hypothetical protein